MFIRLCNSLCAQLDDPEARDPEAHALLADAIDDAGYNDLEEMVDFDHSTLLMLLKDPVQRARFVKTEDDLVKLDKAFKLHRNTVIIPVLNNPEERSQFIKNMYDLTELGKVLPSCHEELIRPILSDPIECSRLVKNCDDLIALGKVFPSYQARIIQLILRNPDLSTRFISNYNDLIKIASAFPSHKNKVFENVLGSVENLCQLSKSESIGTKSLIKLFPAYQLTIINLTLANDVVFFRCVQTRNDLKYLCENSSGCMQKIADNILKFDDEKFISVVKSVDQLCELGPLFRNERESIIARVKSIGLEKFDGYNDVNRLMRLSEVFPSCRLEIRELIFNDPELLDKSLPGGMVNFERITALFPEYRQYLIFKFCVFLPHLLAYKFQKVIIESRDRGPYKRCIELLEVGSDRKKEARQMLDRFESTFINSNKVIEVCRRRNFNTLFVENYFCMMNLMIIMCPARALTLFSTMMSQSVQHFEQFFRVYKCIYCMPDLINLLRSLLDKYQNCLDEKDSIHIWEKMLLTMSLLGSLDRPDFEKYCSTKINEINSQLNNLSLESVLEKISLIAKEASLAILGLDDNTHRINRGKYSEFMNTTVWTRLTYNVKYLGKYQGWYKAMLVCDSTDQSLGKLLHDTSQHDTNTKVIALHNRKIHEDFTSHGINADHVVYYKRTLPFTYSELLKKDVDWKAKATRIISNLTNLKASFEKHLSNSNDIHVKRSTRIIANLLQQFTKGNGNVADGAVVKRMKSKGVRSLITGLSEELEKLSITCNDVKHNVSDFMISIKDFEECEKPSVHERKFRVLQWDKSRPDTFLLGNYLDCCLAASGGNFEAIIERRLDDAMQMHVVIDDKTNKPVCGAWLFFGYDSEEGKVILVANYIELNNKHSKDRRLVDTLLSHLLYFTGELYAKDIVIESGNRLPFAMKKLTYGNITKSHSLNGFDMVEYHFNDKLGGFCGNPDGTNNSYYLASLNNKSNFQLYTPKGLKKEFPNVIIKGQPAPLTSVKAALFSPDHELTANTVQRGGYRKH